MTLSDLASIGSLVSGVAVLVSLVYLAQQTRQNSKHTRALIQQGRAEQTIDYTFQWAGDVSLVEAVLKSENVDPTLDRIQFHRYLYTCMSSFAFLEDQFYQHRDGLVDEDRHASSVSIASSRLRSPGYRACWKMLRYGYASDFQQFMDRLMPLDPAASTDFFEQWRVLASDELPKASA